MAKKYICNGTKYKVGGKNEDTIVLPVEVSGIPHTLDIEGEGLLLRTTFHASLVCIGRIAAKNNINDPEFIHKVTQDFCEYVQGADIQFLGFENEFWFVIEGDLRAVAVRCKVSRLEPFFDLLNKKYGLHLEYPPTHVTLYTKQQDVGIYVVDSDDIKKLTKTIKAPVKL